MPYLWRNNNHLWEAGALSGSALALCGDGEPTSIAPGEEAPLRLRSIGRVAWALLAHPMTRVRVNGQPVPAGLRVLRDRDEIVSRAARWFFSSESLARIEPFPGCEGVMSCARCHMPIHQGKPAVRCPSCGTWCHQQEKADPGKPESQKLECWSYTPTCPLCPHPTPLDAGFRWTPQL